MLRRCRTLQPVFWAACPAPVAACYSALPQPTEGECRPATTHDGDQSAQEHGPPGAGHALATPPPSKLGPRPSAKEAREELRRFAGSPRPSPDWRELVRLSHAALHPPGQANPAMLTDSFGRVHSYLRISLTERCNLRCLYCMPDEGVELAPASHLLSSEEILRLARLFVSAGVDKIRLTGGEPTLRKDLVRLVASLSALPGLASIGITTNGLTLGRQLAALRSAGLTHLNISLDTLRPDRFVTLTRRQGHARVLASIQEAIAQGYDPVKVNVVVMRGVNDDEIADFVEMTRHAPINVRFIEYMPFDGNVWSDKKMVTYREMRGAVEAEFGPLEPILSPAAEVARNFRCRGFTGSVSFITSMTKAFCSDCNRLRLMADGNLKVCLFGANEVSLRDAMREGASEEDLAAVISAAVYRKKAAHAGMFELAATANRAMVKIGG